MKNQVTVVECADETPDALFWAFAFSSKRNALRFHNSLPYAMPRTFLRARAIDMGAIGEIDKNGILDRTFGGLVKSENAEDAS